MSHLETSAKPCDTGSPLSALAAEFPQVDFSGVDPVYPDKTSPAGAKYRYSKAAIVGRAQDALADLYDLHPAKAVVVVSHSGFLRQGVTGSWFFNADYRIFDFEERTPSSSGGDGTGDGDGQPYRLRQWELTKFGGMGWSWDRVVEIGEGVPEEDVVEPPA